MLHHITTHIMIISISFHATNILDLHSHTPESINKLILSSMALGNLTHMSYMRSHPGTIFDLDLLEAAIHLSQKTRFDQHFPTNTLAHYLKKLQIKQTLFFIHRASTTAFIHTGSQYLIFIDTHSQKYRQVYLACGF